MLTFIYISIVVVVIVSFFSFLFYPILVGFKIVSATIRICLRVTKVILVKSVKAVTYLIVLNEQRIRKNLPSPDSGKSTE
jgi:hypothetical protein